jgi:hypothetical protein
MNHCPSQITALQFTRVSFTPETCHIAEIILDLPLRAFDVDTFVRCGAQSGFARIQSQRLLLLIVGVLIISGAEQPVTVITIGKPRIAISPYVLIYCLPPCKAKNGFETRHVGSVFLPQ